ncbi:unnamed protein product [Urochloa humidicola]
MRQRRERRGCRIWRTPGRVGRGRSVSLWLTSKTAGVQSTGGPSQRNSAACGGCKTAPDGGAGGGTVAKSMPHGSEESSSQGSYAVPPHLLLSRLQLLYACRWLCLPGGPARSGKSMCWR